MLRKALVIFDFRIASRRKTTSNGASKRYISRIRHDSSDDTLVGVIDQGTSSSRFLVFSTVTGSIVAGHQVKVDRQLPFSGWVEMCANQIYSTALECINRVADDMAQRHLSVKNIAAIGITNQRETTVAWDKSTGQPLYPAVVWSDSRTSQLVKNFLECIRGQNKNVFQKKTGLPIHSYFSALKMAWLVENVATVRRARDSGRLCFGTVDAWLAYRLMGDKKKRSVTDVTNASRTLLCNIQQSPTHPAWDEELCRFFGVPEDSLPNVISSAEVYGNIGDRDCRLVGMTLGGILGDQQAALIGQTWADDSQLGGREVAGDCETNDSHRRPNIKVTYGTGAFLLWNIGQQPVFSSHGLLTTVAYQMGPKQKPNYALEGSIAYSGATMDWLKNSLQLFSDHKEAERLAQESAIKQTRRGVGEPDACYLVPAFTGLLCPHWKESARGMITGFDESCTRGDLIAAGLRASAYQTRDVIEAATHGNSLPPPSIISVDGGLTSSRFLMQSLADITGARIVRPNNPDVMTALGAAVTASISVGINPTPLLSLRNHLQHVIKGSEETVSFRPEISTETRRVWVNGWNSAVKRSLGWRTDVQ